MSRADAAFVPCGHGFVCEFCLHVMHVVAVAASPTPRVTWIRRLVPCAAATVPSAVRLSPRPGDQVLRRFLRCAAFALGWHWAHCWRWLGFEEQMDRSLPFSFSAPGYWWHAGVLLGGSSPCRPSHSWEICLPTFRGEAPCCRTDFSADWRSETF